MLLWAELEIFVWRTELWLLGFKELGTNVLKLHFVILANHDQNVLSCLDLFKVCFIFIFYFYVKLEKTKKKIEWLLSGLTRLMRKDKTLYKLLLTVNFKLVVKDIIMTCLLLLGLTRLMKKKKKKKHYTSFY